jgi:hypothetical protein
MDEQRSKKIGKPNYWVVLTIDSPEIVRNLALVHAHLEEKYRHCRAELRAALTSLSAEPSHEVLDLESRDEDECLLLDSNHNHDNGSISAPNINDDSSVLDSNGTTTTATTTSYSHTSTASSVTVTTNATAQPVTSTCLHVTLFAIHCTNARLKQVKRVFHKFPQSVRDKGACALFGFVISLLFLSFYFFLSSFSLLIYLCIYYSFF